MNHTGTQTIETKRLILRRFTMNDVLPMYTNWASDPAVTKYLTWPTHTGPDVTEMVLKSWVTDYEKPAYYQWAIAFRESNESPAAMLTRTGEPSIGRVETTLAITCGLTPIMI